MLSQITIQTRHEQHQEKVKILDKELKNLSGENRRSSNNARTSEGSRTSIGSISENNSNAYQFMQDKSLMMNSVKDRLRKMQNIKKEKNSDKKIKDKDYKKKNRITDSWTSSGTTRGILGNEWEKFSKQRCRIAQYNGFPNYSDNKVEYLFPGEEHPKRNIECYCCGNFINSNALFEMHKRGICIHPTCMMNLMENC